MHFLDRGSKFSGLFKTKNSQSAMLELDASIKKCQCNRLTLELERG
jgi:hypothetical protein